MSLNRRKGFLLLGGDREDTAWEVVLLVGSVGRGSCSLGKLFPKTEEVVLLASGRGMRLFLDLC